MTLSGSPPQIETVPMLGPDRDAVGGPLTAMLKIICENLPHTRPLTAMMAEEDKTI